MLNDTSTRLSFSNIEVIYGNVNDVNRIAKIRKKVSMLFLRVLLEWTHSPLLADCYDTALLHHSTLISNVIC